MFHEHTNINLPPRFRFLSGFIGQLFDNEPEKRYTGFYHVPIIDRQRAFNLIAVQKRSVAAVCVSDQIAAFFENYLEMASGDGVVVGGHDIVAVASTDSAARNPHRDLAGAYKIDYEGWRSFRLGHLITLLGNM